MARASDEFVLAWGSLPGSDAASGWQTIPITSSGGCLLRAGRRAPEGGEAFLIGFTNTAIPSAEKLPDGQGFLVERVPQEDGRTWLALTRNPSGSLDLFLSMVCDVAGALDDAKQMDPQTLLRLFIGRVRAWQEFMRKGMQALSQEKEIGLFGEIAFLLALLDEGLELSSATDAWVGPRDAEQDFELGTGAIEVKTTIASTGFPARIGSLAQLEDSVRQPLYVAGLRLTQLAGGLSLTDIVCVARERVRSSQQASSKLGSLLLDAGYFDSHAPQYTRRFELISTRILLVDGAFPKLTRGTVPGEILAATYTIDLDKIESPSRPLSNTLVQLGIK